jgi:hypothetical protein
MPIPADVRPGDLITAQFINGLLAELRAMSGRLATLEARPDGGETPPPGTIEIDFDERSFVPAAGRPLDLRYVVTNDTVGRADLSVRAAITAGAPATGTVFDPRILTRVNPLVASGALAGGLLSSALTDVRAANRIALDVFASPSDRAPTPEFSVAAGDTVEAFVRIPARVVDLALRAQSKVRFEVAVLAGGQQVTIDSRVLLFNRREP